ncbi:MAG: anaerobic ribonucleoside-triphosphate reductase activating protein [Clostridia bacterium]|nr:anaerobic ribonucleoside-triphosphate reductase activating protein [Clostridia bacterium]
MIIAGLQKNSLVDYRGKVAAVVFTPYCNFDCYYCHNRMLLETDREKASYRTIDEDEVFSFLVKRIGLIQGVVITGGEPTLQKDLSEFIIKVRDMGYPVKLDTNGGRPDIIRKLLNDNLLDAIAMDIKAPIAKYDEICGNPVDVKDIQESIRLIIGSGIETEFRTTVVPEFSLQDIEDTARLVKGCDRYVIQQFRRPDNYGGFADIRNAKKPHSKDFFKKATEISRQYATEVLTRGV